MPRAYYYAKPWTPKRVNANAKQFWNLAWSDFSQASQIVGQHLAGVYLLRVPLITLALLAGLPIWIFIFDHQRPLLGNLFADLTFWSILAATAFAFLTAASAVACINAILVNGHERFHIALGKYYGGPFHWLVLIAPAPLILAIAQFSVASGLTRLMAILCGLLVGAGVLIWIRLELAERSARIKLLFDDWKTRPLVYPYELAFDNDRTRSTVSTVRGYRAYTWLLYPSWMVGHVFHWLRLIVSWPVRTAMRYIASSMRESDLECITDYGRTLKGWCFPQAGFVYVPEDSSRPERPFYTAPHYLLLLAFVLFLGWLALSVGRIYFPKLLLPALIYLLLSLWLACLAISALMFVLDRYRVPLLSLLVIWAAIGANAAPNDHYFDTRQSSSLPQSGDLSPSRLLARYEGQPVILVAAAGGGIQAAAWTARVLTELAKVDGRDEQFASSVALLSGVSGGAVGVYYFADAYGGSPTVQHLDDAYQQASGSSLDEIAWALTAIDFPRAFFPWRLSRSSAIYDRGWALERTFDERSRVPGAMISDWEKDVLDRRRPAVLLNATLVESGAPLLFGTTRLPDTKDAGIPLDWVDFRSLPLDKGSASPDVRVATAVRLSASFPFVTPVAVSSLAPEHDELSRHVADGGYYDNFGMMSLMAWLNNGLATLRDGAVKDQPRRIPSRVLVVEIRSFPAAKAREREQVRSSLFQFVAPLQTLASVRSAAQDLRNRQAFDLLQKYWELNGVPIHSLRVNFTPKDSDEDPPLSWMLSKDQRSRIDAVWDVSRNCATTSIREFLTPSTLKERPSTTSCL